MGLAMDTVAGAVTGPGATLTAITAGTGDSFTVRSSTQAGIAYLEMLVRMGAEAGSIRVRSPMMHDDVQGSRFAVATGASENLLQSNVAQELVSQDSLIVEVSGAAALIDVGVLGIYYTDLAGASARLISPGDVGQRVRNVLGLVVATTSSATVGDWADTLITVTEDILHANTDYAVLGYTTDTALAAVAVRGQDTSNLRAGGPGLASTAHTRDYFVRLSEMTGRPHIPVIGSANKGATYVSTLHNVASTASNVTLILAELAGA